MLADERQDFAHQFELPRVGDRTVVGGDEEVAALGDAEIADERAGGAVLQLHLHTKLRAILRRDGLDWLLQTSGAINRERGGRAR